MPSRRLTAVCIVIAVVVGGLADVAAAPSPLFTAGAAVSQPARRAMSNAPTFGGCPLMPANHPYNTPVSNLPVRPESAAVIARTTATGGWGTMRFAFWSEPTSGMHPVVVPANQAMVPINYTYYPEESDPGPMPIPLDAPREDNTDKHVLVVQQGTCKLFELWLASRNTATGGWAAGTGAIWDMRSNATRPPNWTSADAAGLPILPGLLRFEEVASGRINHALRMLVGSSRNAYIAPATHQVGVADPLLFPMGARLRLRADFDISGMTGQSRVIAQALKDFGLIVADQGPAWMISGVGDPRWDDTNMNQIRAIPASAFEYVDTGPVVVR